MSSRERSERQPKKTSDRAMVQAAGQSGPVLACSAATHRAIVCVVARQRYRPRQATSDKPKRAQAAAGCLSSSGRFSHRPLRPQVSLPASVLSASPISSASSNGACAHILSSVFAAASVQRAAAGRFAGCKRPCWHRPTLAVMRGAASLCVRVH